MRTAIKQLSTLYLTAASGFAIGMVLSHHPVLADRADKASEFVLASGEQAAVAVDRHAVRPVIGFAKRESEALIHNVAEALSPPAAPTTAVELDIAPFNSADERHAAPATRDSPSLKSARAQGVPPADAHRQEMRLGANGPMAAHRHAAHRASSPVDMTLDDIRSAAPAMPPAATSRSLASIPAGPGPSTDEIAAVERRLKDNLTPEMYDAFELFLYVSKAASGPIAQHMYVFEKQPTGDLTLADHWPVSTGREKVEYNAAGRKLPSFTPTGYFELDPHRFYESYWSHQWNEPMPYSMFFNWIRNGQKSGLAIHSAAGDEVGLLGTRASAGCIRLAPDAARTLFELIRTKYRGLAPRFAIDRRTGTMSRDGIVLHDPDGHVRLAEGYKALIFIEDYGGENVVAAIY